MCTTLKKWQTYWATRMAWYSPITEKGRCAAHEYLLHLKKAQEKVFSELGRWKNSKKKSQLGDWGGRLRGIAEGDNIQARAPHMWI